MTPRTGLRTYRRVVGYVDRILEGARPGDLPVQPATFELAISERPAKALGFTIPAILLDRGDRLIR